MGDPAESRDLAGGELIRDATLTGLVLLLLVAGVILNQVHMWGVQEVWLLAADVGLITSIIRTLSTLRTGRLAVDIVAVFALIGTVVLDEHFAGALVAVMVCSGALLESIAAHRAERGLSLLASRAPTTARRVSDSTIQVVPASDIVRGDTLWVADGDVVPVDGRLLTPAILDESSVTGEPMPAHRQTGESVSSGVTALQSAFTMIATETADASTYATIVRLVASAEATSAPMVRMADRWAVRFVAATAGLTALTYFLFGGARAVSVLVIATPCPLILAAPIAMISGIAVAARHGVIVKGGAALEGLASATTALLDKTGTITVGHPRVSRIVVAQRAHADGDQALALAASLEQASPHVLAASVVESAIERGMSLSVPTAVKERAGKGVSGTVRGHTVQVGTLDWVQSDAPVHDARAVSTSGERRGEDERRGGGKGTDDGGGTQVFVSIDHKLAATLTLTDEKRPDINLTLSRLRDSGITRMIMVTGDRAAPAAAVASGLPLDCVHSGVSPADKQRIAVEESAQAPTMMIGDGINDAPALAAAGVGIAIATRGSSAASQAADVVLVHNRLDAIADARLIAIGSIRIASQSVAIGMALCGIGMIAATLGYLPAPIGAAAQEGIDLAAIGWALRATSLGPAGAGSRRSA